MESSCDLTVGLSGQTLLCLDGFFYSKKNSRPTSIRWRCIHYKRFKCNGGVTTSGDHPYSNFNNFHPHSHPPQEMAKEVNKFRLKLREEAKASLDKPAIIMQKVLNECPEEVQKYLGKLASIKRDVRKYRSKSKQNAHLKTTGNTSLEDDQIQEPDLQILQIQPTKSPVLSHQNQNNLNPVANEFMPHQNHYNLKPPVRGIVPPQNHNPNPQINDLTLLENQSNFNSPISDLSPLQNLINFKPPDIEEVLLKSEVETVFDPERDVAHDDESESDPWQQPNNDPLTGEYPPQAFTQTSGQLPGENNRPVWNADLYNLHVAIARLETISKKLEMTKMEDELDQFGKYLLSLLRGLPQRKIRFLQKKIVREVFTAMEIQEMSTSGTSYYKQKSRTIDTIMRQNKGNLLEEEKRTNTAVEIPTTSKKVLPPTHIPMHKSSSVNVCDATKPSQMANSATLSSCSTLRVSSSKVENLSSVKNVDNPPNNYCSKNSKNETECEIVIEDGPGMAECKSEMVYCDGYSKQEKPWDSGLTSECHSPQADTDFQDSGQTRLHSNQIDTGHQQPRSSNIFPSSQINPGLQHSRPSSNCSPQIDPSFHQSRSTGNCRSLSDTGFQHSKPTNHFRPPQIGLGFQHSGSTSDRIPQLNSSFRHPGSTSNHSTQVSSGVQHLGSTSSSSVNTDLQYSGSTSSCSRQIDPGFRPYSCLRCASTFGSSSDLKQHYAAEHAGHQPSMKSKITDDLQENVKKKCSEPIFTHGLQSNSNTESIDTQTVVSESPKDSVKSP